MKRYAAIICAYGVILAAGWTAGCAPQLRLTPPAQRTTDAAGQTTKTYDFNADGKCDYRQVLDASGRVRLLQFDRDNDEEFEQTLDRALLDPQQTRHLFLLLDGVPFWLIETMWNDGHFRLFGPPGRIISPLPSLTDEAYDNLFHCGKPFGYEACYFDRSVNRRTNGTQVLLSGKNEAWLVGSDYHLSFIEDAIMYLWPKYVFKQELNRARKVFDRTASDRVVLYILSTDGLAHMTCPDVTRRYLTLLDRWIERLVYDSGGELHVTMMADHGNNFTPSTFVPIERALRNAGLHVTSRLRRPGDVVVPKFGLINFASIFCYDDITKHKAIAALQALEGLDAIAWQINKEVYVRNRNGLATIKRKSTDGQTSYRYEVIEGDPLGLANTLGSFRRDALLDADGFAADQAWFEATRTLDPPDPLHRIYTSLTSGVQNTADIIVSLADGWYFGDESLDRWVDLKGTHGGLSAASTVTFSMSTVVDVPKWCRHEEILPLINRYLDWTPHIDGIDYTWLLKHRAERDSSVVQAPPTSGGFQLHDE